MRPFFFFLLKDLKDFNDLNDFKGLAQEIPARNSNPKLIPENPEELV